jgi:hypothetical protein
MKYRNKETGKVVEPFFEGDSAYCNGLSDFGSRQMYIDDFEKQYEPLEESFGEVVKECCGQSESECKCEPEWAEAKHLNNVHISKEEVVHILEIQRSFCKLGSTATDDGTCSICWAIEQKLSNLDYRLILTEKELGDMYVKVVHESKLTDGVNPEKTYKTVKYVPLSEYRGK